MTIYKIFQQDSVSRSVVRKQYIIKENFLKKKLNNFNFVFLFYIYFFILYILFYIYFIIGNILRILRNKKYIV